MLLTSKFSDSENLIYIHPNSWVNWKDELKRQHIWVQYSPPLATGLLSEVSVNCGQLKSKNIKWNISEINNSEVLN